MPPVAKTNRRITARLILSIEPEEPTSGDEPEMIGVEVVWPERTTGIRIAADLTQASATILHELEKRAILVEGRILEA